MIMQKNVDNVLLIIILFSINNISGNNEEIRSNQPMLMKYTLQSGKYIQSKKENMNSNQDEYMANEKFTRISNKNDENSRAHSYDNDDADDEIMKTSEQIAFRPLFRHRQMMEERKQRKQERRESAERRTSASNVNNRYNSDNIYICYGQNCRPITAYDIRQFQLLHPTTRFYQQRRDPEKYFNEYAFTRNGR